MEQALIAAKTEFCFFTEPMFSREKVLAMVSQAYLEIWLQGKDICDWTIYHMFLDDKFVALRNYHIPDEIVLPDGTMLHDAIHDAMNNHYLIQPEKYFSFFHEEYAVQAVSAYFPDIRVDIIQAIDAMRLHSYSQKTKYQPKEMVW